MTQAIDFSQLTPVAQISGEDATETDLLRTMHQRAEEFVESFDWCPPISECYLAVGIGGVVALFLFRFDRSIKGNDNLLWVVEGDLPSAYFVVDRAPDAKSALQVYCELMDEWADAVLLRLPRNNVFPVAAAPTDENAMMLKSRVRFIRDQIIPSA